ncbi:hypothetical protein GQ53DRAFT_838403 [Thozetella sp. PMI_491]|nr:hypothetical protein GQ53DRAFT_838403 [Thozetella sp. PMI_491]
MEAHNLRQPRYHEALSSADDLDMQTAHPEMDGRERRRLSIDSLCEYDDNVKHDPLIEQGLSTSNLDPVSGSHLHASLTWDTVEFSSGATEPKSYGPADRGAAVSNGVQYPLQPPNRPHWIWGARLLNDTWFWEILAITFSIACMVSVAVLASGIHQTWLSRWTFLLQPSTLISILVTGAQSSMMLVVAVVFGQLKWLHVSLPKTRPLVDLSTFDSASRGPLGSLSLFYRWKPHSAVLIPSVYAASLTTIASLGMGPFAQQIVTFVDNQVPRGVSNSTIAVTNYYNNNYSAPGTRYETDGKGGFLVLQTNQGSIDVASGMEGAFYSGRYGLDGPPIDFGCPSNNCSWTTFTTLGLCSTCKDVTAATRSLNDPAYGSGNLITPGGWNITFTGFQAVVSKVQPGSATLVKLSAHLSSFAVVQNKFVTTNDHFIITECSVAWCAKQFSNVTVINGDLQDEYQALELPLWAVKGQDFGGLARNLSTSSNFDLLLTTDANGRNISSALPPFQYSGFNISIGDHLALGGFFDTTFDFQSDSKNAMFGFGKNVTATAANITASMTKKIPMAGNATIFQGIVWERQSIIQIQFAWLALPSALVVICAILLIATITMTRQFGVPVWKSSPLPLLYHGIRDWDYNEAREIMEGRLEKLHIMEDKASWTRVRMYNSPQGGSWLAR